MPAPNDAAHFVERLDTHRSPEQRQQIQRYFKLADEDQFIGVKMGQVFETAKQFLNMPVDELEKLLESPVHEVRTGALSIMNQETRRKKTPEARRKALFDLYLRRHDRINNWDLVDLGAPYVIGGYLFDKPRDLLYTMARSANMWERRTATVSNIYFVRQGDVDDTFKIAEMLLTDEQDLIHKATGWLLRYAGDTDRPQLHSFLDQHAATMPRTALRYALEHFDKDLRDHYMGLKKKK